MRDLNKPSWRFLPQLAHKVSVVSICLFCSVQAETRTDAKQAVLECSALAQSTTVWLTSGLVSGFLDLAEGIHNDSQQEIEQHHEDQELKRPEEEGGRHPLQALQQLQVIVHADVTQQNGKAGVHGRAKGGELLQQRRA